MNRERTENDREPNGERTEELTLLPKRSVFLRYDIGMPSKLSSAKMERVLASLRVQSYNAKKRNPNFLQIRSISKTQNDENENTRLIMGRQQNPMFDYLSKNNISRASLTPLGRVFKIRKIFP